MAFGWGDGGGGSTESDLEMLSRSTKGLYDCPAAKFGTVKEFFDSLHEKVDGNKNLPVWDNELYLEYHRGTYTNISKIKRNNRKAEFALTDLEIYASMLAALTGKFSQYPKAELDELWKLVLTDQFHDILPGSSIDEVYDKTDEDYARVFSSAGALTEKTLASLISLSGADKGWFVLNPNSFGGVYAVKNGDKYLEFDLAPKGYTLCAPLKNLDNVLIGGDFIESDYYRVEFDDEYFISRIYDKENSREVLKNGEKGNVIRLYDDYPPKYYDAWDVRNYYGEKYEDLAEVVSVCEVRLGAKSGLKIVKRIRGSVFTQTVLLSEREKGIDFITKVDWHEKHRFVKALFPLDLNSRKAVYDVQFGNIERNSPDGNSWDKAKFEVCGQKFADVSEGDYGVSLLSDCKYGYSFDGGVLGLSLLRSSTYPSVRSECGEREFSYRLYPHARDVRHTDIYKQALSLNNPPMALRIAGGEPTERRAWSLVSCASENVVIDAVKRAEDGESMVIRCFESLNAKKTVRFTLGFAPEKIVECDLMENDIGEAVFTDDSFVAEFRPFEIKTFKIFFRKDTSRKKSGEADTAIEKTHRYIRNSWNRAVVEPHKFGEKYYLPYPFVPPCVNGLFRTLFYWDTYFTNKGLIADGRLDLAKNNVDDLLFMLGTMGYVPNSWSDPGVKFCSQPPYLHFMVADIYEKTHDKVWLKGAYRRLKSEYSFWQRERTTPTGLNRYYHKPLSDDDLTAYYDYVANERVAIDKTVDREEKIRIAHNLVAVAESGMDWTPRFGFSAADVLPVDLNANLYALEKHLAEWAKYFEPETAGFFFEAAKKRKKLMDKYMLSDGVYYDYNYALKERSHFKFSGQFLPFIVGIANDKNGAISLLNALLYDHGVVSTEKTDDTLSYQWSYPNSWAPDNYLAYFAMKTLGEKALAEEIKKRYMKNVADTFLKTGALWEKYDGVVGGAATKTEHEITEMLGWTGGVFSYFRKG